jgi:DNA (cytosine-5)-methyltransferase 1
MKHLSLYAPKLIVRLRRRLRVSGLPWVIENVPGAPLRSPIELCGTMFGLQTWRHRLFECNFQVPISLQCNHHMPALNPHNQTGRDRIYAEFGRQHPDPVYAGAMGVGWMSKYEGREAIPPAMTHFIGFHLWVEVGRRARG